MKKLFLFGWLLLPIGAVVFHYGPGQRLLAQEKAAMKMAQAKKELAKEGGWEAAVKLFAEARAELDEAKTESDKITEAELRRIRREQLRLTIQEARLKLTGGQVIESQEQLESSVADLKALVNEGDSEARPLLNEARSEVARAGYFAAWLMRLEGATAEEWKPEAEIARQQYRLLAEGKSKNSSAADLAKLEQNLEATIRLEQMDLSELEALPLPKDCPCNCSGLSQRKRKQRLARSKKKKGKGKGKGDARKQVQKSNGAGMNKREGSGS